jgi:transposase
VYRGSTRTTLLAVYLNTAHFVPLERTSEILQALCGARASDGTIVLNLQLAAERLVEFKTQLKAALLQQPGLHADATGSFLARTDSQQGPGRKVNGKLQWMHVVSCAQLTQYGHHAQPGFAALEAMNVLPQFKGLLMHDAWSTYCKLFAKHALCGVHLLRELRGLVEHHAQIWAGELATRRAWCTTGRRTG